MNEWIEKYLKFYDASLSRIKSEGEVVISKLNGKETNLKISINLETFYKVVSTKYIDDPTVSVFISDDKELVSISSENVNLLKDIMFQYGGWIDETYLFKNKYTLQIFEHIVSDFIKFKASI